MLSLAALLIIWPVLALFQKYDHKVFAYYLMQDYAHSAKLRGAYPPELKERLRQFKEKISVALTEEWDESLWWVTPLEHILRFLCSQSFRATGI